MAMIYEFGPFRLDADAEILLIAEPIVLGRRAVARPGSFWGAGVPFPRTH